MNDFNDLLEELETNILELEQGDQKQNIAAKCFQQVADLYSLAEFEDKQNLFLLIHLIENQFSLILDEQLIVCETSINTLLQSVDLLRIEFSLTSKNPPNNPSNIGVIQENKYQILPKEASHPTPTNSAKEQKPLTQKIVTPIKVHPDKLDELVESLGEIVILYTILSQDPVLQKDENHHLTNYMSEFNKIISILQKQLLEIKMVPIKSLFVKMQRLIKDTSEKTGKKVLLKMTGEATEVDKSIVDRLSDPLVHILRNAVDHGIESPQQRTEVGKLETGTIHLQAKLAEESVFIYIQDDGGGIDPKKVYEKALEKGIINPENQYNEQEIISFILLPGFSTANQVTDISGRGVGMDAVVKDIKALNGNLKIQSEKNQGSTFIIELPLQKSLQNVTNGLVAEINGNAYVVPLEFVVSVVDASHIQSFTSGMLVEFQEQMYPLIDLKKLFRLAPCAPKIEDRRVVILVENDHHKKIGILVDNLVGNQKTVIRSLPNGAYFHPPKFIAGYAILGNEGGLLLNVPELVAS